MAKPRGSEHTSLTETAQQVVQELYRIPGVKMIAPGEIKTNGRRGGGARHLTCVYTTAGLELIITGQSVQKVAVHTGAPQDVVTILKTAKSLRDFAVKERERKPGI